MKSLGAKCIAVRNEKTNELIAITGIDDLPSADVQPVVHCKDCQWLADIKDIETGELYQTCGVLAFDVPDGFACNQGKRKGADNVPDE